MRMEDLIEICHQPADYDHEVRAQIPNPIGTPKHHRIPKHRFNLRRPPRDGAGEQTTMADKKEKKAKAVDNTLGTKEVAAKLGIKPAALRRYLRSKGKGGNGEYTRYSWKPEEDLSKLKADFAKYQDSNKKKAKPAKKAKTAPKKEKKAAKKEEAAELE